MSILLSLALIAVQPEPESRLVATVEGKDGSKTTMPVQPIAPNKGIDMALAALKDGKPGDAVALLDVVIADFEKSNPQQPNVMQFSARTITQSIMYAAIPGTQKKNGVVYDGNWALAYYLKGYALIDLKQADEALIYINKALALSPMDSQYLGERGEWYKSQKQWDKAYADFESARTYAPFSEDDFKVRNEGRALRGMGFVLIEQGKLKEAKKMFKDALKLDPNDEDAKGELQYIDTLK